MAKRKPAENGFTRQDFGPYRVVRWAHNNRFLITKLPFHPDGVEERLDVMGVGPTWDVRDELAALQSAVPGLPMVDYLDKLMSNRRHEVVFISIDA